jgi:two-component system chemotaxis response regulator CheB
MIKLGELTPLTCPECHGTLVKLQDGSTVRFRCHTGHSFTADSLLSGITQSNEEILWQAIKGLDEAQMLLEHLGTHYAEAGQEKAAGQFFAEARRAENRAKHIRETILKTNE